MSFLLAIFLLIYKIKINNNVRTKEYMKQTKLENSLKLSSSDHIKSTSTSPYTLIEYFDFNCIYCYKLHVEAKKQNLDYFKINYVQRIFPKLEKEDSFYKAQMGECVYNQSGDDGYFKYIDDYFNNWNFRTDNKKVIKIAEKYVQDKGKFYDCVDSDQSVKKKIETAYNNGLIDNIDYIPTFLVYKNSEFVNKYQLVGGSFGVKIIESFLIK